MSDYDYFLEHPVYGVKQVTKEEWISAERSAGFYPKGGGDGPATGGFSSYGGIRGFIRPTRKTSLPIVKLNPNRRTLRDDLQDRGII